MAKPPKGLGVNGGNPLARGLIAAFQIAEASGTVVGDQGNNNASEGTLSGTSIPTWSGVNDTGLKFAGGAALASYVTFGAVASLTDLFFSVNRPGSVYMKARMGATNTAGGLVGKCDDNTTTRGWQILLAAGPTIQFSNEATTNGTGTVVAPAANTDFDMLWTSTGVLPVTTGNLICYLNGSAVTVTIAAGGATPKTSDSADALRFGTTTGFAANGSFDGYLYEVLIWNRVLSAAEAATLNADPYQVFGIAPIVYPPTRRVGNARGPFDNLGFLKRGPYDYTIPSQSAPPIDSTGDLALAPSMSMSGSGIAGIIGAGAMAIAVAMSGTGQQAESGSGNLNVPAPVLAGTAQQTESGTGSVAIGTPVLTGTGQQTTTGSGSLAISLSMDGLGIRGTIGTGSMAVPIPSLSGTGQQTESGSGNLPVALSLSGAGQQTESGSGSLAVAQVLAGIGQQTESGSGSLAIGTPQFSGTGTTTDASGGITGTGALAVSLSLSGTGQQTESGSGDLAVSLSTSGTGQQTQSGTGSLAVALSIDGTGTTTAVGAFTGSGSLAVPNPSLDGTGTTQNPITGSGDLAVSLSISGTAAAPDDVVVSGPSGGYFGPIRYPHYKLVAQALADSVTVSDPETFSAIPSVAGVGAMSVWPPQPDGTGALGPAEIAILDAVSVGGSEGGGATVATRALPDKPRTDRPVGPDAERPDPPAVPLVSVGGVDVEATQTEQYNAPAPEVSDTPAPPTDTPAVAVYQGVGSFACTMPQMSGVGLVTESPVVNPLLPDVESDDSDTVLAAALFLLEML